MSVVLPLLLYMALTYPCRNRAPGASSVLAAQSLVHGIAALVAISTARRSPTGAANAAADRQERKPDAVRSELH